MKSMGIYARSREAGGLVDPRHLDLRDGRWPAAVLRRGAHGSSQPALQPAVQPLVCAVISAAGWALILQRAVFLCVCFFCYSVMFEEEATRNQETKLK